MNRLLLFLCCICASWMARGQAAYEWLYWFDMNHASRVSGQSIGDRFTITADADGLSEGIHTIHVQVADTAGKYSPPLGQLFYYTSGRAVKRLYYWFDNEAALAQTIPAPLNDLSIDVSGLEPGLHFIYCQVEDAAGIRSDVMCRAFYRRPVKSALKWTYWFDDDEDSCVTVPLPGEVTMIDVSHLQEGFHVLHSQVYDVTASDITTTMFIKVPQTEGVGDMTCICTVDGKLVAKESLPTAGGILKWNMDVDNMDVGIHKAMFQVITPSGAASSIAERYFVRAITNKEMGGMKCIYTIDNFQTQYQAGTLSDGLFHFDLDVASIENGLHRLAYTLVSETGVTLPQKTAFFWKTPLGGDGIVQYNYWLNDRDDQQHVVRLDKRTNPFSLIALLPVETQPIRSSNFQFAIKNGEPLIYARNEFHIQFFDTNGRMVEETKEYYDEQVNTPVKPVGELQATQTFDKVAENDIRWYTMQVAPGDTAAFKLSQPATVQVFAPSGEEVFKTSESASVKWSGIHTWEEGTYYLAVHDVTGSKEDMTLEYMHMDKYDVVDWDVHRVGNGGCSTITFKGNGFRDLYAVDLVIAPGDTIHSAYVSHDSDAETAVIFDFTAATLGDYNAVFHFTEEDKSVANVVTVEEAVDIELATNITYPSTFLRGTSTTYSINIKNYGNMTAYSIPIYVYISSATLNGISNIKVKGLKLKGLYDYIENKDSIDERTLMEIRNLCDNMGEDHYFNKIATTDEQSGDSIIVRSGFFTVDLPPNTIKTVTIEIRSTEMIDAWFTIPDEWHNIILNEGMDVNKRRKESATDWLCCYHERLECLGTIVVNVSDVVGMLPIPQAKVATVVSCVTGIINQTIKSSASVLCNKENVRKNFYEKVKSIADGISITGTVLTCASKFVKGNQLKELLSSISLSGDALTHPTATVDCITAWSKKKPNCPPKPPKGGKSTPQPPGDPNDIYGYLSEAGSKFIADSVARVNYTIEFENDTTFATAAAHTIVIKDTLDNNIFDLTKFMPTGIRIGEREAFLDEADVVTKNNVTSFVKTIDMRPEINAIAQVDGTFNQKNGIAQWTLQSLDPMTMEPTDDLMQGILPVNYNGTSGIGEVMFEVGVKQGKTDGTQIKNRAGIVFDYEEAILTPTWTNIVDAVAPSSVIDNSWMVNDSTLRITADGFDERSGVWKYTWYVQAGENAPWWKEGETESPQFDYHIFEGIDYGFCVLATDSAGNVEQKVIQRERGFKTYGQDYEDNISPLIVSPEEGQVYDLSGRRHNTPQEGVNIIDKKKMLFRRKGK